MPSHRHLVTGKLDAGRLFDEGPEGSIVATQTGIIPFQVGATQQCESILVAPSFTTHPSLVCNAQA